MYRPRTASVHTYDEGVDFSRQQSQQQQPPLGRSPYGGGGISRPTLERGAMGYQSPFGGGGGGGDVFFGQPQAQQGDGGADRYVRLLERDLENLRAELKAMRERANDPEMLRELQRAQEELRQQRSRVTELEREASYLREEANRTPALRDQLLKAQDALREEQAQATEIERELHRSKEASARTEELQAQLSRMQDDLRKEQSKSLELQREMKHTKDSAALEATLKISELQSELNLAKQEVRAKTQEVASKVSMIQSLQGQLQKEVEGRRTLHEEADTATSELRARVAELESKLRTSDQTIQNLNLQLSRRDELMASHEGEEKASHEKLRAAETAIGTLQGSLKAVELRATSLQHELEHAADREKSLAAQLSTSEAMRKDALAREDKLKAAYGEVANSLRASEVQRATLTVHAKLVEWIGENTALVAEATGLRNDLRLSGQTVDGLKLKIEQLNNEIALLQEDMKRRDLELAALRDELLLRTRELRDMTVAREQDAREHYSKDETSRRLHEVIEQKERQVQELTRQLNHASMKESNTESDLRLAMGRMEAAHTRQVSQLQMELEDARTDRQYADVCRSLGRLLRVDPDVTSQAYAQKIVSEVEDLRRDAEEYRRQQEQQKLQQQLYPNAHLSQSLGHTQWAGVLHGAHQQQQLYAAIDGSLSRSMPHEDPWLKSSLREGEERWIKLRVQFDSFKREVAHALDLDEIEDEAAILSVLRSKLKRSRSAHGGRSPSPERHAVARPPSRTARAETSKASSIRLKDGRYTSEKAGGTKGATTRDHHHDEQDYKRMEKKLKTAIQTIESQDLWIDLLNRKIEQFDKTASRQVHSEAERIESQVAALKKTLRDSTSLRPETSGDALEMKVLKEANTDLQNKVHKLTEFRDRVIHTLGIKAITVPDYEVILQLEAVVQKAIKMDRMDVPSTAPHMHPLPAHHYPPAPHAPHMAAQPFMQPPSGYPQVHHQQQPAAPHPAHHGGVAFAIPAGYPQQPQAPLRRY